jgi:hypothetical protein
MTPLVNVFYLLSVANGLRTVEKFKLFGSRVFGTGQRKIREKNNKQPI